LTKLAGKKSDEEKRKEKELEKQKEKEKQIKRQEKLEKKKKDKDIRNEESSVVNPRQSLFQRLFSKSKSCEDDQTMRLDDDPPSTLPPIPPHGEHLTTDGNGNPEDGGLEIDDSELQKMIDSNNLELLDNMVSEFAHEIVGNDDDFNASSPNNNINSISANHREVNNNPAQQLL